MNNVRQFIFPGAIAGSMILASFGYTVMARAPIVSSPASGQEMLSVDQNGSDAREHEPGNVVFSSLYIYLHHGGTKHGILVRDGRDCDALAVSPFALIAKT